MNIFVGIFLGQLLFCLTMYAGESIYFVSNVFFSVYSLYVIYLSIRNSRIGIKWARLHSWLFPFFITSVIETLFKRLLTLLIANDVLGTWIWFAWMVFFTRIITIPLTMLVCYFTLKRIQPDSGHKKWIV